MQGKQDIFNIFPDCEMPDRGIFRCWQKILPGEIGKNKIFSFSFAGEYTGRPVVVMNNY